MDSRTSRNLKCPNARCPKRLSFPADQGRLRVRCPSCGTEFTWEPEEDIRVIPFVCARGGEPFEARFARRAGERCYRIETIQRGTIVAGAEHADDNPRGLLGVLAGFWSASPLPPRGAERLPPSSALAKPEGDGQVSGRPERNRTGSRGPSIKRFPAEEFDTSGWYCPWCGHGRDAGVRLLYVQCFQCRQLVCGSRVREIADGVATFACHPACGCSGPLHGTIRELAGAAGPQGETGVHPCTPPAALGRPVDSDVPAERKGLEPPGGRPENAIAPVPD